MVSQVPLHKRIVENVLISLGSNVSLPKVSSPEILREAILKIETAFANKALVSSFYQTECFPTGSGPDFVNAALKIKVRADFGSILLTLHEIEAEMGRVRTKRWGERVIDLDLIAVGGLVAPDERTHAYWRDLPLDQQMVLAPETLILPHPRLQDRSFVLVPLAEIAPDWVHPLLGRSVDEMLAQLPASDIGSVVKLDESE